MSFICTTMIPSYKRADLLPRAIESFRATAVDPTKHQVVVRLIEQDETAEEQRKALLERFENCKVMIGRKMGGYVALGLYYTQMIPLADGEWINIWDDDMTIEGAEWDRKLLGAPPHSLVLCHRYQLGPILYGHGSLDGAGTGWFMHKASWQGLGETEVGFPPDAYGVSLAQRHGWPVYHLQDTVLNHQWRRPYDGDR